ncbi:unnamed protein product [Mucor hiemalis]
MKSFFISAVVASFVASVVNAECACDPADTQCVSNCVRMTNECISECQSNNICYQRCISNNWPGADASSTWVAPTPSWTSSSWVASSTAQWTSSGSPSWYATPTQSSQWGNPSSSWPSISMWSSGSSWAPGYTNTIMAPSPSAMPSSSGASITQISKAVVGLGLALAAYVMH